MLNDKKGVFGLTSIQQFFAIILAIALLAYVIVVIMGTLNTSGILGVSSATVFNETGFINRSADILNHATDPGFSNPVMLFATNATDGVAIVAANFTLLSNGTITNATAVEFPKANFTYTFNSNSPVGNNANSILGNTSSGVTSFFSNINPVYAILAIMVIILVLVVLVRVVSGSTGGPRMSGEQDLHL